MISPTRCTLVLVGLAILPLLPAEIPSPVLQTQSLPRSALAVHRDGEWRTWWQSDQAPRQWAGPHPEVLRALRWRDAGEGMEWDELILAGEGARWRFTVLVVRLEPSAFVYDLVQPLDSLGRREGWNLEDAPPDAAIALNAGQFSGRRPWGWVVRRGVEAQAPGTGPLSMALVADTAGTVRLVGVDAIEELRGGSLVTLAFQSYPTLLSDGGTVPAALTAQGSGVDLKHRDSRLAVGELRDGRLIVALTRFGSPGGLLARLPLGPTMPETAAIMGALGCIRAVALDGGISGQVLLREPGGVVWRWPGLRQVPLGLVGVRVGNARQSPGRPSNHRPVTER